MGCILQLQLAKRLLACPCHVTTFNLDGKLVAHQLAAPPRDLPTLEARVREGNIEVLVV
jgi:Rieske Fe-S protein